VAILTGDIHSSWAFDVPRSPARLLGTTGEGSLAVELVTPAISSPPLFATASMRDSTALLQLVAPHLKFVEASTAATCCSTSRRSGCSPSGITCPRSTCARPRVAFRGVRVRAGSRGCKG
jgi:hypothetical protein